MLILLMVFCLWFFVWFLFWGKYWELVHDQRMWLWQSECADGLSLLIVVALELGSQGEVCRSLSLICLQPSLLVVSDRCRAERWHLVRTDHAHSLQSSHSTPRMVMTRMIRIIVRMHAMVRVARATRSGSWSISALSPE